MSALALISDLMTQSQASAAAQRAGVTLRTVYSTADFLTEAQQGGHKLLIVDLSHPGLNIGELVEELKKSLGEQGAVLAFGPHVHRDRLEAAQAAGCQWVLSRGQFHAQTEQILLELAAA